MGIAPQAILAIAFTNKACGEIAVRLHSLLRKRGAGIEVRTFHAAAWRLVVRPNAERLGRFAEASILTHSDSVRLARQAIAELGSEPGGRQIGGLDPREAYGAIAYAKAHLRRPAGLEWEGPAGAAIAAVWRRYARLARAASAFDFEDMLAAACHLLAGDEAIRSTLERRFSLLLLDEYQDASPAQRRLVELVAGENPNLTVIGDPEQAIYAFRGGDAAALLDFVETHPGARTVLLHRNYRSRPEIVRPARRLANGHLGLRPRSARRRGGRVDVAMNRDEEAEAETVFEMVLSHANRGRTAEVAVLARVERHLALVERHLVVAGLPYRVLGGQRALERVERRGALAYLRLAHNPRDLVALAICAEARRGVGEAALRRLRAHCGRRDLTLVEGLREAELIAGLDARQRAGLASIADGIAAVRALAERGELVAACRLALRRSGWMEWAARLAPLERERARRRVLALGELVARECGHLDLEDSLRLCLLMWRAHDRRFERAAVRWLGRLLAERPGIGLDLARQALDGLANMAGTAPDAGRSQLAVVLRAVGELRAADVLLPLSRSGSDEAVEARVACSRRGMSAPVRPRPR